MLKITVHRQEFFPSVGCFFVSTRDVEIWPSFARAIADHDPFQNGAHTTMPTWYVQAQLDYMGYAS